MNYRIKHLPVAALTLGAALSGGKALASNSHFAELQIAEASLATLIQRQVKANPNFCPIEIPCPTNSSQLCYVDHFDVDALGTLSRGSVQAKHGINDDLTLFSPEILFSQPIVVHIKTRTCADTPGCTTTTPVPLNLSIGLSVNNEDLCFAPKPIAGIPPSMMPAGLSACVGLDMSGMIDAVGTDGELSGIGLSLNSSNSRIAIRSEYGRAIRDYDAARISAWQTFLDGTLSPSANKNWSAFVHKSLVVSTVSTRFSSSLEQAGGTALVGGLNVAWTPLGSAGARMDIDFEVDVSNTPCPNDIGADISIPVFAQLNGASNGIELHGGLSYSAHAGDLFVCGLLTGGGLLGPLAGTLGIAVGKAISIDLSNTSNGCVSDSDGNFNCDMQTHPIHISIGFGQTVSILLDEVSGSATGLSLAGPMSFNGSQNSSSSNVHIVTPSFGMFGGCNSNECGTEGGMYITGTSKLCSVDFSGDTLNVFEVTPPTELTLPADFGIKARENLTKAEVDAYNDAAYGLVVTVATANGINSYQIPPSDLVRPDDQTARCYFLQLMQSVDCLEPETPIWVNPLDRYLPDWEANFGFDFTIVMVDARGRFVDFGLLTKSSINMRTSNLRVQTASLDGEVISKFGGRTVTKQRVSMDLPSARGVSAGTTRQLVDRAFSRGLSQSMALNPRQLPSGVSAATMQVDMSVDALRSIAR